MVFRRFSTVAKGQRPFHFHQAIPAMLLDAPGAALIEISPHPAVSSYVSNASVSPNICPVRRPGQPKTLSPPSSFQRSTLPSEPWLGVNSVDLTALFGRASRIPASDDIPYPFTQRQFPYRVDGPGRHPSPSSRAGICSY